MERAWIAKLESIKEIVLYSRATRMQYRRRATIEEISVAKLKDGIRGRVMQEVEVIDSRSWLSQTR